MADLFKKIRFTAEWWPFILLACNVVLFQFVFGSPVAQLQVPDYPNQINYVGDAPLPGGTVQSILSANFTPNQIVTGSGVPTNPSTTGTAGAFSVIGNTLSKAGIGLGSSLGMVVKGIHSDLLKASRLVIICVSF